MTLDDYINQVDSHILLMTDLSLDDLADTADLDDLRLAGVTAFNAARTILKQNGWKG